jgi:hypothetical protein
MSSDRLMRLERDQIDIAVLDDSCHSMPGRRARPGWKGRQQ